MTINEFDVWLDGLLSKRRPTPAGVPDPMEPPADMSMVKAVEKKIEASLPWQYRHFVMKHGAGGVLYTRIASPNTQSDDYILNPYFDGYDGLNGNPFLRVIPDECGGFGGFMLKNGVYQPEFVYIYEAEGTCDVVAPSFFDYLFERMIPEHLR